MMVFDGFATPGKIICVGMNYPTPGRPSVAMPYPVLFLKASSTVIAPGMPIQLPRASQKVFSEGEVAVVIGKQGKHIARDRVWQHIAGLTIANDVGAQELEGRTSQWQTGKLPDTFLPLGPRLVPLAEIPDPANLEIRLTINDRLALQGNSSAMIFDIPALVSYISGLATLFPGDVLVTGSPKGIGDQPAPRSIIRPGDTVSITITGLGTLTNPVVLEAT
ncbi:MAG: fumarylacetoacetate hydrolase family protein [Chloroflexota bacterium]|nr:fumarylacetoacetate hydrolase family protein [Chloroflexota bacterium]